MAEIQNKGLNAFYKAFEQLIPAVEVRPRRVGGSVYQIPMEVRPERAACSCHSLVDRCCKIKN